jgi:hypothetical protein
VGDVYRTEFTLNDVPINRLDINTIRLFIQFLEWSSENYPVRI